jgi:hypothetical protein
MATYSREHGHHAQEHEHRTQAVFDNQPADVHSRRFDPDGIRFDQAWRPRVGAATHGPQPLLLLDLAAESGHLREDATSEAHLTRRAGSLLEAVEPLARVTRSNPAGEPSVPFESGTVEEATAPSEPSVAVRVLDALVHGFEVARFTAARGLDAAKAAKEHEIVRYS